MTLVIDKVTAVIQEHHLPNSYKYEFFCDIPLSDDKLCFIKESVFAKYTDISQMHLLLYCGEVQEIINVDISSRNFVNNELRMHIKVFEHSDFYINSDMVINNENLINVIHDIERIKKDILIKCDHASSMLIALNSFYKNNISYHWYSSSYVSIHLKCSFAIKEIDFLSRHFNFTVIPLNQYLEIELHSLKSN